jgi:hypothetical protein
MIISPFEAGPSEIVSGQVVTLDTRAHGAVVNKDALGECIEVSRAEGEVAKTARSGHEEPG